MELYIKKRTNKNNKQIGTVAGDGKCNMTDEITEGMREALWGQNH